MTNEEFEQVRMMIKSRSSNDINLGLQLLANSNLTRNQINSIGRWIRRNWYLFATNWHIDYNPNYYMLGKSNSYCFYSIIQDFYD